MSVSAWDQRPIWEVLEMHPSGLETGLGWMYGCNSEHFEGWFCSRPTNHPGGHIAHRSDGSVVEAWGWRPPTQNERDEALLELLDIEENLR